MLTLNRFPKEVNPGHRSAVFKDQMTLNLVTGNFSRRLRGYDPLNQFYWCEDSIEGIREMLLMDTLRDLTDGRAALAKDEAMEWMLSDEVHPFSFKVCCNAMGLDHHEVRSRVLYMIDRLESTLDRRMTKPEIKEAQRQFKEMRLFQ